ncbi:tail fiber protein [Pseudomonas phage vB_PpuP-Mudajogi]|uniref:Tail fiber protein n=1 Tax=Pseudomonas phage vB_PpuP-Mudajogi TaxID=3132683 RepID=A0AAX4NBY8_9CAUD
MEFPTQFSLLKVLDIQNPKWSSLDHLQIDVDITVQFKDDDRIETIPFTACPWDTFGDHCPAIFEHAANMPGIKEWERPDVTVEDLQMEFDKIWPDVLLGLADDKTVELAKTLRIQIKAMS